MRRLNLVLLASLQLCSARQPGFSIHDDLLAHPQFEVVFSDSYISETDALALLESNSRLRATDKPDASQTDLTSNVRESAAAEATARSAGSDTDDGSYEVSETYEILSSPPSRYLCSVPTVAQAPELNHTATELAKAEEARELSRASARGWELMSALDGHCLYFMSGWWSYSFCYGKDIVQFHALPGGPNGGPPVRDPNSHEYVLGTVQPSGKWHGGQKQQGNEQGTTNSEPKGIAPSNTELQIKGDQRYLVQRLEGGTICDLTGRPRTIEIQYHCNPGASVDRIGWIKEITTCTYLMVVQTPRLCADVAFQPPKETRAHPISCRPIISTADELEAWHWRKTLEAKEAMGVAGAHRNKGGKDGSKQHPFAGMTIGGIVVGGKRVLGSGPEGAAPVELTPPRRAVQAAGGATAFDKLMATWKKKEGDTSNLVALTPEELEQMGMDSQTLEALREELQRRGGDDTWEIAVEVIPPGSEEAANTKNSGEKTDGREKTGQTNGQGQKGKKPANGGGEKGSKSDEEEEGSQEVFKDEL